MGGVAAYALDREPAPGPPSTRTETAAATRTNDAAMPSPTRTSERLGLEATSSGVAMILRSDAWPSSSKTAPRNATGATGFRSPSISRVAFTSSVVVFIGVPPQWSSDPLELPHRHRFHRPRPHSSGVPGACALDAAGRPEPALSTGARRQQLE